MAMIVGKIHVGSGLGNQLHTIVMTKVVSSKLAVPYGFVGIENFKGNSFIKIDWGKPVDFKYHTEYPAGKLVIDSEHELFEENTNYYNPEINFIEDATFIDGFYQDERYFKHKLDQVDEWLKVEPIDIPEDLCVIGFRGGEYYVFPELGLPKAYFEEGVRLMKEINPNMRFEVHTDDPLLAQQFFPDYKIIHDIGINWRSMRYAKYSIIANSSFYIFPRLLRDGYTIAPRYWARHNTKEWSMPQNYYKSFNYINV